MRRSSVPSMSPMVLLVIAPLLWSSNFVLGRGIHAEIAPVALAFWRWTLAAVLLAPVAWHHVWRERRVIGQRWRLLVLLAVLGVALFDSLNYLALQTTPATNALLLQSAIPVLIVLFSFVLFRERMNRIQVLGLTVSLAGAIAIISGGRLEVLLALDVQAGNGLAFLAVLSYSAYTALLARRPPMHPIAFLLCIATLGSLMLLPAYLWERGTVATSSSLAVDSTVLLSLGYLALFPSIIAYLCYIRGVELLGSNRAGSFIHLMPLFGSVLAVLFLGEEFRAFHAVGLVLILLGVAVAASVGRTSRT